MSQLPAANRGNDVMAKQLRGLPSVGEVADRLVSAHEIPHLVAVSATRAALTEARAAIRAGINADDDSIFVRALALAEEQRRFTLRPIINAAGVIVSTNLGRAPLASVAIEAMVAVARGYSNLEYDIEAGVRGSRQTAVRDLLRQVTGAEDALVVNNNAAALLVVLAALAPQREVVVSRGELVEIGGGFRIPDLMRQSGAQMVEVGTTNRTRVRDFEEALSPETSVLLVVHPSNFRMIGFTQSPTLQELADLAHAHGLLLIHDVGSGCLLNTERWGLIHEPTPQESVLAGADIVCFSGDKLLGGPQAGIIIGRETVLGQVERHPLMRAVRIDKLSLAALEATLGLYRDGLAEQQLPVWRAIAQPVEAIRKRAEEWASSLRSWGHNASTLAETSTVGGGSLPGETLPTVVCAIELSGGLADRWALLLRQGSTPIVARIARDRLLLDPRTVQLDEDEALLSALKHGLPTN